MKYITFTECRQNGRTDKRYGMFYIPVGADYIGKRFKVIIEEVLEDDDEVYD